MSIKEVLREKKAELESAGIQEIEGELILAYVLGVERMDLHARAFQFTPEQSEIFDELIAKRISGKPTQYLIGQAPFRYLTFEVGDGVLIPRPESEALVDEALAEIKSIKSKENLNQSPISIVDLGAGSGALAISIADESRQYEIPVTIVAVDKLEPALKWLKRNIEKHDLPIRIVSGDVLEVLEGVKCDIVIANPPYIPDGAMLPPLVVENEPRQALFGGGVDGLDLPKRFIAAATRLLKPGGLLIIEHHESQSLLLEAELSKRYSQIKHKRDLNNRPRFITARREAN